MSYCVFMHRADSIYDDSPAEQYQFPKQYLSRALQCVGDWIVYLEPARVRASRGYFGMARVQDIVPDPAVSDMYLAVIEPGSYLDFGQAVPFNDQNGTPIERGLLNPQGRLSGRAQSAVRPLSTEDFVRIVERGLDDRDPLLPRTANVQPLTGLEEAAEPFVFEHDRDRIARLVSRPVRDRVFRKIVLRAYDERCAITGLKLINGGGRAEVQAAHIRPVERRGPDIVTNGLALSGTVHWMFDRGLLSLSNDLDIMVSRHINDVDGIKALINRTGKALVPARALDRPHPHFLAWHRETVFKI